LQFTAKGVSDGWYRENPAADRPRSRCRKDPTRTPHETLSDREYEVMSRIASGKTVTEIAEELSLSAKTIGTYRARVLEKLDVKNSAEIVQYAMRNGLVI
jgi:two-component system, NarL family, invasion response regulator UvrY